MWYWERCVDNRVNLKSGRVSSMLKLNEVARRARWIVDRRNSQEIEAAAANVDSFIEQYFEDWGYPRDETESDRAPASFCRGVISDASALRDALKAYDLDSDPDFPKGEAYEYFAVLALCHAIDGELFLSLAHAKAAARPVIRSSSGRHTLSVTLTDVMDDPFTWWHEAAQHALEAQEAMLWAEALRDEKSGEAIDKINQEIKEQRRRAADLVEATRKSISEMASRNAAKRHAGTNAAKRLAHKLFRQHRSEFRSLDALAEAITEKIEAEASRPDFALCAVASRTIRRWLTEFGQPGYAPDKP